MPVACERSANESRKSGSDFTEIGVGLQLPTSCMVTLATMVYWDVQGVSAEASPVRREHEGGNWAAATPVSVG
eukprot:scaffold227036_cov20-Tisochrysis_lutea.AAC.3